MKPQDIFNKSYEPAYNRIWADYGAGELSLDQALDRLLKAWRKAAKLVRKITGYASDPSE